MRKIAILLTLILYLKNLFSQTFKEFPHIKQVTVSDNFNNIIKVRNVIFFNYNDNQLIERIEIDSTINKKSKYLYYYDSKKSKIKTEYLENDTLIFYTKHYNLYNKEIVEYYYRKSHKQNEKFVLKRKDIKEYKADSYVVEKERFNGKVSLHYIFLGFSNRVYHKYFNNNFLYFYKVQTSWGKWGYSTTYIIEVDKYKQISYSIDKKNNFIEKHINYYDEYGNIIKSELYSDFDDNEPIVTSWKIIYE